MDSDHDLMVRERTGGLVPQGLTPFAGSERLRPDGRPRAELRKELRRVSNVRNAFWVMVTLLTPIAVVWAYAALDRWWLFPVAFVLMGATFPRFFILNHEAAHRLLFTNTAINDLIGEKIVGRIVLADGSGRYRKSHSRHHRDEFGPGEPDFGLYAGYPIASDSFRRKLTRDAFGRSALRIFKPFRLMLLFQAAIFAAFFVAGHPFLYPLLWILPWATYWRVVNRLRALAEHAGMTRSDDRRETTHHIEQNRIAAFFFVPFNTGFHLAHHVDSGVPWNNLPKLHRVLAEDGYLEGVTLHPNYRSFWRTLTP